MTKIRYFVRGAIALFVDSMKRERKITRADQILLRLDGIAIGMLIILLNYIIFKNVC